MHKPLTDYVAAPEVARVEHVLHRDIETFGTAVLKAVGAHRYTRHSGTGVYCVAFAVDDEPVQLWRPSDPVPAVFFEAAKNSQWVVAAHNANFEAAVEEHILAPRYGWPLTPIARHRCTMAMSLADWSTGTLRVPSPTP